MIAPSSCSSDAPFTKNTRPIESKYRTKMADLRGKSSARAAALGK